jgi:hypothetical protein
MKYTEILQESIQEISPQMAKDENMFGPIYHGTLKNIDEIIKTGFNVKLHKNGPSNGYTMDAYAAGLPAPIHHLGFGIYGTTVKAIAKQFNGDTTKNLKTFYLNSQNILEINFGSPNTMMRFWIQNGYDMTHEEFQKRDFNAWVRATGNLTRTLRKQYDAVWFKGKSIYRLLDGDQICVYKPGLICLVNNKLASGLEVGAKVTHTGFNRHQGSNDIYLDDLQPNDFGAAGRLSGGWKGLFRTTDHEGNDVPRNGKNGIGNHPLHFVPPPNMVGTIVDKMEVPEDARKWNNGEKYRYTVKWNKGGVMHNYTESELKPLSK